MANASVNDAQSGSSRELAGSSKGPGLRVIGTLLRLMFRSLLTRLMAIGDDSARREAAFGASMKRLADNPVVAAHIGQMRLLTLSGDASGWQATGLGVRAGERVTVLGVGSLWASKLFNLRFGPRLGFWLRTDEGTIFKTPREAATVTMPAGGPLQIVAKPPGEWADETGAFDEAYPRQGITGALQVCVIVWKGDHIAGMRAMLTVDPDCDDVIAAALEEAMAPLPAPRGWRYLWAGAGRHLPRRQDRSWSPYPLPHQSGCRHPAISRRLRTDGNNAPRLALESRQTSLRFAGRYSAHA